KTVDGFPRPGVRIPLHPLEKPRSCGAFVFCRVMGKTGQGYGIPLRHGRAESEDALAAFLFRGTMGGILLKKWENLLQRRIGKWK
ncbi:MAG: hypothetical protein Q4E67_08230, partial [Planctomycetia bacterium]|nr:hypothetical protein [Planctomycetia bacterium]